MEIIDSFKGDHRFLSNFWFFDNHIHYGNATYPTVEHFFVAMKTTDLDQRRTIAQIEKPGAVKRAGRELNLRDDWDDIKYSVMRYAVEWKFQQNPDLAQQLLNTKNALLIEGNYWHDQTWGNCYCEEHTDQDGQNALGTILMNTRLTLLANTTNPVVR